VVWTRSEAILGITFSVAVLAAVVVFSVIGGSPQQTRTPVDLIGTGHSVSFSKSTITVHDVDGDCSGHADLWWLNETGTTQHVIGIYPNLYGVILPPNGPLIGECDPPGTYTFGLQSSPRAKLVVTVDSD
jgi:hypothetical protein